MSTKGGRRQKDAIKLLIETGLAHFEGHYITQREDTHHAAQ
jgi:hypothetical protein